MNKTNLAILHHINPHLEWLRSTELPSSTSGAAFEELCVICGHRWKTPTLGTLEIGRSDDSRLSMFFFKLKVLCFIFSFIPRCVIYDIQEVYNMKNGWMMLNVTSKSGNYYKYRISSFWGSIFQRFPSYWPMDPDSRAKHLLAITRCPPYEL